MASYEQNENREWSVRFRYAKFGQLHQKRLSGFKTKRDAEKAYSDFLLSVNTNDTSTLTNITFLQLYNNYFEYMKPRVKISTQYDIRHNFENHLLPYFEKMKIYNITKKDIFAWQQEYDKKKLSYSFKSKLRDYLNAIFRFAVYYYDLPVNPVTQVEPFRHIEQKKEMTIWSKQDFEKFIAKVDNFEYKTFFLFLYLTGCRKGEAFALTWNKIDFDKQTVTINQNLTRKVDDMVFAVVPTKTYNTRSILIPKILISYLIELQSKQENYKDCNYVFGGNYPLADNTITRAFYSAIKKADVKQIHLHSLRHSHASYLISQGESIVMVSKRLGHSTVQQTLNTYSHLMPNEEAKMVKKLELDI